MTIEDPIPSRQRNPWNKGRQIGQKRPLEPNDVWSIRMRLQLKEHKRDLATFNLAIDSKLRGCDLVRYDDRAGSAAVPHFRGTRRERTRCDPRAHARWPRFGTRPRPQRWPASETDVETGLHRAEDVG
jgi:hypothetical protein